MFHRALLTGIVLFWLVMTGLLVRVELFPGDGDLLPVPLEHIERLIFLHQQPSDLVLYNGLRQRLGNVRIQPQRVKNAEANGAGFVNLITGTGATALTIPGLPSGRMTFRFSTELNDAQQMQRFEWAANLHAPKQTESSLGIQFDGQPPLNRFHYTVHRGQILEKEASGTPAELLSDPDLAALGFDPRVVLEQWEARQHGAKAAGGGIASQLAVNARRGSLRFNGEEIETFVITVRYADSLESTIHISQLGQILSVKTFTGYNLYDETLTP